MSEFIFWWIIASIAGDALTMLGLTLEDRSSWKAAAVKDGWDIEDCPRMTVVAMFKETPWWAHVIMLLIPFSGLLMFT